MASETTAATTTATTAATTTASTAATTTEKMTTTDTTFSDISTKIMYLKTTNKLKKFSLSTTTKIRTTTTTSPTNTIYYRAANSNRTEAVAIDHKDNHTILTIIICSSLAGVVVILCVIGCIFYCGQKRLCCLLRGIKETDTSKMTTEPNYQDLQVIRCKKKDYSAKQAKDGCNTEIEQNRRNNLCLIKATGSYDIVQPEEEHDYLDLNQSNNVYLSPVDSYYAQLDNSQGNHGIYQTLLT